MVNDNIITALRNAIDRGETIDHAINTLLNSGYSQKEINEAMIFFGPTYRALNNIREEGNLVSPEKKPVLKPVQDQVAVDLIENKVTSSADDSLPPPPKNHHMTILLFSRIKMKNRKNRIMFS